MANSKTTVLIYVFNSNPGNKVFIVLPGEHERMKNIVGLQ